LAKQQREALEAGIKERDMSKLDYALMKGGFKAMQSTSPYALAGIGAGGEEFTNELQRVGTLNAADRKELLKQSVDAEKSDDARRAQMLGYGLQADTATKNKAATLANIASNKDLQNTIQQNQLNEKANNNFQARIKDEEARILADAKFKGYTPEYIRTLAYNNVVSVLTPQALSLLGNPVARELPPKKEIKPAPVKEPSIWDKIKGLSGSEATVDTSNPLLK
jgi:hypothetical protein